jgi:hypothetical protein
MAQTKPQNTAKPKNGLIAESQGSGILKGNQKTKNNHLRKLILVMIKASEASK